jgi:hypothetical protein
MHERCRHVSKGVVLFPQLLLAAGGESDISFLGILKQNPQFMY